MSSRTRPANSCLTGPLGVTAGSPGERRGPPSEHFHPLAYCRGLILSGETGQRPQSRDLKGFYFKGLFDDMVESSWFWEKCELEVLKFYFPWCLLQLDPQDLRPSREAAARSSVGNLTKELFPIQKS